MFKIFSCGLLCLIGIGVFVFCQSSFSQIPPLPDGPIFNAHITIILDQKLLRKHNILAGTAFHIIENELYKQKGGFELSELQSFKIPTNDEQQKVEMKEIVSKMKIIFWNPKDKKPNLHPTDDLGPPKAQ